MNVALFEIADRKSALSQSNVWEPGENPGRLRHCKRLQTPNATDHHWIGKAGARLKPQVRIPVWLRSSWL